jgi:hypothetical protein
VFKIITNHAISANPEQLCIYLGGMGGTGKSQVIKALSFFFEGRKKAHRFIIVALTGTAATLLGGSMYHCYDFFPTSSQYFTFTLHFLFLKPCLPNFLDSWT